MRYLTVDVHMSNHKLVSLAFSKSAPRLSAAVRAATGWVATLLCAVLLASCGGGGGGGEGGGGGGFIGAAPIAPSAQYRGTLINTAIGAGAFSSDWSAATCTDNRQKNWVRSFLNENYLFYRDAPLLSIDPNTYTGSIENLFLDYTKRGVPAKDKFSFVLTQTDADGAFQTGTTTDVGITLRRDTRVVDANNRGIIRIAYVDANGPARAAGFVRGMVLATVDGVNTSFSIPAVQFDKLFSSPAGTTSVVGVQDTINGPIRNLTVSTASFSTSPLLLDRVLPGTATGYLAFTSFSTPIGEVQLADAFNRFATAGVTDLVVDIRYNGGGYIDIASQLGYMVAGQIQSQGRIFESLVYNDKRSSANENIFFNRTITNFFGNTARAGEPLAALNLRRVYVLTTGSTCSASESFISGLQGIDVEVIQIGGTTCGKPYGFSQTNNCTLSYFALEFEGRNNKSVVTPVTGLPPTCFATDDFDRALGDPAERLLAAALNYKAVGSCPPVSVAPATPLGAAPSADSASPLNQFSQNPYALNPDMEFMTRPSDSIKVRRSTK